MTPCPRCGRMLAALARRGLHRLQNDGTGASWIALHVGDHGRSDCRFGDAEAADLVNASAPRPSPAAAA